MVALAVTKRIIIGTNAEGANNLHASIEDFPDGLPVVELHAHAQLTVVTATAVADMLLVAANIVSGRYNAVEPWRNPN